MTRISPELLNDTLSLVQLAREAALARGNQAQAQRLEPIADNLRSLVNTARQAKPSPISGGLMGQSDFQRMLAAMQVAPQEPKSPANAGERNQVVIAMAHAGMGELDIARHMGMAREEVRMIISLMGGNQASSQEVDE